MWQECLRVLKPGGHLLSFSSSRTCHRMTCAIEDAGFKIRDQILWVYGSGFPKGQNIGLAVDKILGNKRQNITGNKKPKELHGKFDTRPNSERLKSKGNSNWEGWNTCLKPAYEPICMAQKPIAEKTIAANVLKYGTGAINVDKCRIGHNEETKFTIRTKQYNGRAGLLFKKPKLNSIVGPNPIGRYPANFIHDNSDEVKECFPESISIKGKRKPNTHKTSIFNNLNAQPDKISGYNDEGNNIRFFKSIIYTSKASSAQREDGCKYVDNLFAKLPEIKNNHPTVKPVELMEYLITLITPPQGLVLDPFTGSGTTAVAAQNLGFSFIGIELDNNYLEIARRRIK